MSNTPADLIDEAFALHQSGQLEAASSLYRTILTESPDHAEALHLHGILLHQIGDHAEAAKQMANAVDLAPHHPGYLYNFGVVLQELGNGHGAKEAYQKSLSLDPGNPSCWVNLGNLLSDQGRFTEAIDCHRNSLKLQPNLAEHLVRLSRSLRLAGDIENALANLGIAVSLNPEDENAQSNLLFTSQYQPGIDLPELHRRHTAWASRFPAPISLHEIGASDDTEGGNRSIRIGFLSPDLGNHPVGIFMAPLLERLRESADLTTVCFNDQKKVDEFLIRNHGSANEWHEMAGLSDDELERQLRDARLDVLIELTGHTDNNRLPVLARKPVPIQLSWAGYVGTTGLEAIDYLISDNFHTPDGSEEFYAETLLRFPCDYIPYEPPSYAPDIFTLPMLHQGYPTFGCLNNPTKLTSATIALWGKLLRRLPTARLILKYKGMDDPVVKTRVLGLMAVEGIEADRIEMEGQSNHIEHLTTFSRIDVALDPLPYSGGLSTCEAIWMGVPVVTLPGDTFASRHSFSHLSNAELPDTIADSEQRYLEIATALVEDPEALAAKRKAMRNIVANSPLCDLDSFAQDFTNAIKLVMENQ